MNQEMLTRIATIKTSEVERELPRIHISSAGVNFQLMVWRNVNKEKVRNIRPIINEGIISAISKKNYFYFLRSGDEVYFMSKVSNKELVAFLYNIETSTVTPVANSITFYPKDEAIQDLVTVYATCMAYLNENNVSIERGGTYVIDKVTI